MSDLFGASGPGGMGNMNGNNLEDERKKKMVMIGMGVTIGVIVIIIIIMLVISAINNAKNNIIVDGASSKLNNVLFIVDTDGTPYVCIEKIAPKLNYEFYNGEFGAGNEDRTHAYVKNVSEIAMFQFESPVIYKTLTADTSMYDYYKLTQKVKRVNDRLYISLPMMQRAFNVKYSYDKEKNNLTIQTLPYLVKKYDAQVKEKGYKELAGEFINQKAIIQDMIPVIKDNQYGVLNKDGSVLIGTKYPKMAYQEGTNEFIFTSGDKMGALKADTSKKIDFVYDELKLIDNNLGLYLVRNDKKYGVLDKNGETLIRVNYDYIGIKNSKVFPNDKLKNPYVLFDTCIPVQQGDKWGMFNINGEQLRSPKFYGFGCVNPTDVGEKTENVLLIPPSEGVAGIVISEKSSTNKVTYGVINMQGTPITTTNNTKIYMTTSSTGVPEYYMLFGSKITRVKDALIEDKTEVDGGNGPVTIN